MKSGAPSGRGGDAGCCGAGSWADGDVTGLPLASLPSSGLQVAGRPAAGRRPRRQRDLRTVRAGGRGSGSRGRPKVPGSGGAARAGGGPGVLGRQRSGATLGAPSPEPPAVQRAGRTPLPGGAVTGIGAAGRRGCSLPAPGNQGEAEEPSDFKARMLELEREST